MQILLPLSGSVQRYAEEIVDVDRYRPDYCPQCEARVPLTGHGFYCRTLVDVAFDGIIRVRRYLCHFCKRTTSLLPDVALPWLRFSVSVIALFLVARLLTGLTLRAAARAAVQATMPYQRGQFWIRRFQKQAPALSLALAALVAPPAAADFVSRALRMARRPSLPVFATARASAGLARGSGSVRVTNHTARSFRSGGGRPHSICIAEHPPARLWFGARRCSAWIPKPKNSRFLDTR